MTMQSIDTQTTKCDEPMRKSDLLPIESKEEKLEM